MPKPLSRPARILLAIVLAPLAFLAPVAAWAAEPLVDVAWLKANLGKPGMVILSVRSGGGVGKDAWLKGHIPGAVFTDYAKDGWREKTAAGIEGQLPALFLRFTRQGRQDLGEHGNHNVGPPLPDERERPVEIEKHMTQPAARFETRAELDQSRKLGGKHGRELCGGWLRASSRDALKTQLN